MERWIPIAFAGLLPIQLLFFIPDALGAAAEVGPLWTARYDGPSFGLEAARRICVGRDGSVYVAGSTAVHPSYIWEEYVICKYDPSGKELWVARPYPGTLTHLALDPSGNVCATGVFMTERSMSDIATLKLDPAGNELWLRTFSGPNKIHDDPAGMAVDGGGNISIAATEYYDDIRSMEVLKYEADGTAAWIVADKVAGKWACSIACDLWGTAYLLRNDVLQKYGPGGSKVWEMAGTWYTVTVDIAGDLYLMGPSSISKYDPQRRRIWQASVGAHLEVMALAEDGSVAVAGFRGDPPVLYVGLHDPLGDLLWEAGGDALPSSFLERAAIDSARNVLVMFSSQDGTVLMKHDLQGNRLWCVSSTGMAEDLALDGEGNPHLALTELTAERGPDLVTRKYDAGGNLLWEARYEGPGHAFDQLRGLALDRGGNILVAGVSRDAADRKEIATMKFDPSGSRLWVARSRFSGSGTAFVGPRLDPEGNIFIAIPTSDDVLLSKLDAESRPLWEVPLDGAASLKPGSGYGMTVDRLGNALVASKGEGYVTAKIDPGGNRIWTSRYSSVTRVAEVQVDDEGSVFLLGNQGWEYSNLVKCGVDGEILWEALYKPKDFHKVYAIAMAIDRSGDIYVATSTDVPGPRPHYADVAHILKYDSRGNLLWALQQGTGFGDSFHPVRAALDPAGSLIVAGISGRVDEAYYPPFIGDFVTAKYGPDGAMLWKASYPGTGHTHSMSAPEVDGPSSLAVDRAGNVYVAGNSTDSASHSGFIVIEYGPGGEEMRVLRAGAPGEPEYAEGPWLALDGRGDVYMAGARWDMYSLMDYDCFLVKFEGSPIVTPFFIRGDPNGDGEIDLTDAVRILSYAFLGEEEPECSKGADTDDNGSIDLTDAIRILDFLFLGGLPPDPPFPDCGLDVTPDALTCDGDSGCQG